jgi:hypothetical protein
MSQSTASLGDVFELSRNLYQVNKRSTRPGSQRRANGLVMGHRSERHLRLSGFRGRIDSL